MSIFLQYTPSGSRECESKNGQSHAVPQKTAEGKASPARQGHHHPQEALRPTSVCPSPSRPNTKPPSPGNNAPAATRLDYLC